MHNKFIILHQLPWATRNGEVIEIQSSTTEIRYQYFGSPLLSVPAEWTVIISKRYEKLSATGVTYYKRGVKYILYRLPHGETSHKKRDSKQNFQTFLIKTNNNHKQLTLEVNGAVEAPEYINNERQKNAQSRIMLSWTDVFDRCIRSVQHTGDRQEEYYKIDWKRIFKILTEVNESESTPRRSLITEISKSMHKYIHELVNNPRKILSRERRLVPAGKIKETDTACLHWYVRQPGKDAAEKAARNSQRLLGVSRYEAYDTLENRVLKDFLRRCRLEANKYIKENREFTKSDDYKSVQSFGNNAEALLHSPTLTSVKKMTERVKPNYVLLHDKRYRKIWKLYKKLIKQDLEEDILWDWQANTWADLASIFVNLSLKKLTASTERFTLEEILNSTLGIYREQKQGVRIRRGNDTGPYLLKKDGEWSSAAVLEIIHASVLKKHKGLKNLDFTGGDIYLAINHLNKGNTTVIVVWSIHEASSLHDIHTTLRESASKALDNFNIDSANNLTLRGLIIGSSDKNEVDFEFSDNSSVCYLTIPQKPNQWMVAIDSMALILSDYFEKIWSENHE